MRQTGLLTKESSCETSLCDQTIDSQLKEQTQLPPLKPCGIKLHKLMMITVRIISVNDRVGA